MIQYKISFFKNVANPTPSVYYREFETNKEMIKWSHDFLLHNASFCRFENENISMAEFLNNQPDHLKKPEKKLYLLIGSNGLLYDNHLTADVNECKEHARDILNNPERFPVAPPEFISIYEGIPIEQIKL